MQYVRGSTFTPISGVTINAAAQSTAAIATQDTDLELWDQVSLTVTMASSTTTLAPWSLYLLPDTPDDATSGTVVTPPSGVYLVAQWPVQSGTSAQVFTAHGIVLPPGEFTYVVYNGTATNSAASSVTLSRRPYHVT
jgi:hypothetical protein